MTKNITLIIRLFIAISFIVLGGCVLYFQQYTWLSDLQAYSFAGLLFIYGLFRIYRAVKRSDDVFIEE
jgi:hypothetical protein